MPSFIIYESFLGCLFIKPTNPDTDLGTFTIKGEVSDNRLSTEFSFKVEVYNNPPYMKDNIPDFTLQLGTPKIYTLPNIEDEEGLSIKIIP